MNIYKYSNKIAKGGFVLFFGMMLGRVLTYIYVVLISKLGSSKYGLLSLGFAISLFLSTFALLGLRTGVVRYTSYYLSKKNNRAIKGVIFSSIRLSLPLSLVLTVFLFIFSKQISLNLFHNPELIPILKLFSLTIPFISLSTLFLSVINGFQKIEYQTGIKEIFENFIKLILTFILIYFGYDVLGVAWAYIISLIVTFILSFYFLQKKIFSSFISKLKPILIDKELLLFSLPLIFTGFLVLVIKWVDVFMIGIFRTTSEVGIYNVALPTANLLVIVPTALMGLFMPIITELYSKRKFNDIKVLSITTSKWIFFVNLPLFFIILLFSKRILNVAFGSEYVAGYGALLILIFGYLFHSLTHPYTSVLGVIKKTNLILYIMIVAALINVLLNYILIPKIGIIGGAIATSFSLFISFLLSAIIVYKLTKINTLETNYFKAIFAGIISFFIIYSISDFFDTNSFFILISFCLLFLLVYFVFLIIFKSLNEVDKKILFGFFNGFKKRIRKTT